MADFFEKLTDIKALCGSIPTACGVLNNFVFPVIPITPLLRGLAVLILLVTCTLASLWALSFSNDTPPNTEGNANLRRTAVILALVGVGLLIAYLTFAMYFNSHDVGSLVLNVAVDGVQAALFASPWTFWSAACVLMVPRKQARTAGTTGRSGRGNA